MITMRDFILKADKEDVFLLYKIIQSRLITNNIGGGLCHHDNEIKKAVKDTQKIYKDIYYKQYLEAKQ